jgi:L-arabonate dehydrase
MGTASTMAIMAETLGMAMPGSAVLASGDPRQAELAEEAGRRIVAMVRDGVRPSAVLTPAGFSNALAVLAAVGGSTNAIIHLCAVAGRRGLSLALSSFGAVSERVPVVLDVAPIGPGSLSVLADLSGRSPVVPLFRDLRGWPVLHRAHVTQAPEGCDYDFLQARTPDLLPFAEPVIGRS